MIEEAAGEQTGTPICAHAARRPPPAARRLPPAACRPRPPPATRHSQLFSSSTFRRSISIISQPNSPAGRLINLANMASCTDCDFALQNGGVIRGSLNIGNITYLDIKNMYPFGTSRRRVGIRV